MMHQYQVGQLYNATRTRWQEGTQYNFRSGAHELLLFLRQPTAAERRSVKSGAAQFALVTDGPLLVLLFRFDPALPWSDAPYTYHLLPLEQQVPPPELAPGQGVLLTTLLVNADSGILEVIRVTSLSPHFSRVLHAAIDLQRSQTFDQAIYDQTLQALYVRYSTEHLLGRASARSHGGD